MHYFKFSVFLLNQKINKITKATHKIFIKSYIYKIIIIIRYSPKYANKAPPEIHITLKLVINKEKDYNIIFENNLMYIKTTLHSHLKKVMLTVFFCFVLSLFTIIIGYWVFDGLNLGHVATLSIANRPLESIHYQRSANDLEFDTRFICCKCVTNAS